MSDPDDKGHPAGDLLPDQARTLRRRAEEKLDTLGALDPEALGPEETRRLLHELQVHQIELAMQNEELRRAQEELEASSARYVDLYDFAPVGYLTVSEAGRILGANLTAATLLSTARGTLVKQPLTRFILPEDQDIYYGHRKALFATGEPQACELRMKRPDGVTFCARLDATLAREEPGGGAVCRVTMADITTSREAGQALATSARRQEESNQQLRETEQQLRAAQKALAARNRIAEIFLTIPDQEMYQEVLKIVLEVMESTLGVFGYLDDQGGFVVPTMTRTVWDRCRIPDRRFVFPCETWGDSSWPRAIREKRTIFSNGPATRVPDGHIAITRHVSVPLVHRGLVVGLIQVANKETDYSAEDLALLETIGRAIAPVLDARLQRERHESARENAEAALREKTEEVDLFFSSALDLLCIADTDGYFRRLNAEWERTLGWPLDELQGRRFLDLVHPDDLAATMEAVSTLGQGREILNFVNRYRCMNGDYRWIEWRSSPAGKRIYASARDITERRRAEEAIKNSEIRFRELFRHMTSGVAVYEPENDGADFVFRDINEAGLRIGGLGREEVVGRRLTEVFPGVVEMGMLDVLRRVWRTGRAEFHPTAHYADDRQSRWYENRVYRLPSGEIVAVYDDVTVRKQAEADRERLLSAIEQAGETVVITDPEGTIHYVNPAFESVTGYSRAEAVGQNPRILKSGVQDEAFYRELWETISGGSTWKGRMVNRRKDGTLFTEEATLSPVRDASGRTVNYVAVKRDITESLELEARFHQAQKMESVGRLAGGMAHDFNNMLAVILGYAELALNRADLSGPLHADLHEIVKAATRSRDLVQHLLAFARKQIAAPRVIDLNDTVEGVLQMLRRLIGEEIELAWLPGKGLWSVRMDPVQVHQILANLCVNAPDAIQGVGGVTLETGNAVIDEACCADHPGFVPGRFVRLAVRDEGCGMDNETLDRLFEPFFTTKEVGQGTGLGLSTVYGIVMQNSGFIDVRSRPGQGTTLAIYLPRQEGPAAASAEETAAENFSGRGETVLLVEDEPEILAMARTMLEGFGYRVLAAGTPEEARRLAERHAGEIRLLIADVIMPEMSGPELAGRIDTLCPRLKHLFMSGYTADVIARRGMLDPDMHFLQKPFSMKDLAAGVRAALDKE